MVRSYSKSGALPQLSSPKRKSINVLLGLGTGANVAIEEADDFVYQKGLCPCEMARGVEHDDAKVAHVGGILLVHQVVDASLDDAKHHFLSRGCLGVICRKRGECILNVFRKMDPPKLRMDKGTMAFGNPLLQPYLKLADEVRESLVAKVDL